MLNFLKTIGLALIALFLNSLTACNPVDRSGEQPFPPTVIAGEAEVVGDSCLLHGEVTASPNSNLLKCGFRYGNDTLRLEVLSAEPQPLFLATTKPLKAGRYYAVAFARNGVGESSSDTIWFEI